MDIVIDVCRSSDSLGGNEVLVETEQTIPLDVLSGTETFTSQDLAPHGFDWSIIMHVTDVDLNVLANSDILAVDNDHLTVSLSSITNGFLIPV